MEPIFTWIHLSDLHFGQGGQAQGGQAQGGQAQRGQAQGGQAQEGQTQTTQGWDQQRVLRALRDDLAAQARKHHVDAVFVTGDTAFHGRPEQYAEARAWLREVAGALGLGIEHVYAVPGNQDVDLAAERDPDIARLMRGLRAGEEAIDTALGRAAERDKLAERLAAYLDFAADLAPACLSQPVPPRSERLFWQHRETHGRLRVRILGLSTALLAAGDQDQGHLALGHEQLGLALGEPVGPGELVIALSHHHLQGGWLADEDEVTEWLRQHVHVHLFGHVHDALAEEARSGTGSRWLRIAAGAAYDGVEPDDVPRGFEYAVGAVHADARGTLHVRLWPRRWSASDQRFVIDRDSVPEGDDHVDHRLAVTLPAEGSGASRGAGEAEAGAGAVSGEVQRPEPPILLELLDAIRDGLEITCPVLIQLDGHPSLDSEHISIMTDSIQQRVKDDSIPGAILVDFAARLFANYGDAPVLLLKPRKPGADRATPVTLGRSRDVDVRVRRSSVSGHHAEVLFDPVSEEYSIIDRGSRNGTFLNSDVLLVEVPHRISSGDRLELAGSAFIFVEPSMLRALADVTP
ncbi:MAG TPA: FHA domain-containing protein [Haliangium sp.]|nr:FHA domain-containing protein [Haliangium sp.]